MVWYCYGAQMLKSTGSFCDSGMQRQTRRQDAEWRIEDRGESQDQDVSMGGGVRQISKPADFAFAVLLTRARLMFSRGKKA